MGECAASAQSVSPLHKLILFTPGLMAYFRLCHNNNNKVKSHNALIYTLICKTNVKITG